MGHFVWHPEEDKVRYERDMVERAGDAFTKGLGSGIDMMTGIFDFFIKGAFILVIIGVVIYFLYIITAELILGHFGIIKAETSVAISTAESSIIQNSKIISVSHQKKPVKGVFDIQEGEAIIKSATRNQSFYLSYDGMLVDGGHYIIPSIVEPCSTTAEFETERGLLVSFYTEDGEIVSGGSVAGACSDGTLLQGVVLENGKCFVFLPENASDLTLTFGADGFENVDVRYDWNKYRLGELEVYFSAE